MALLDRFGSLSPTSADVRSGRSSAGSGAARALYTALARPYGQAIALTLGFALVRLATAPLVGLGVDESYTIAISRQWSLSYFDHPPLHQWIVAAFMPLLGSGPWLRLPFLAISAVTSLLIYRLAARLFGERAGVWATLLFNLAGFFTAAAGVWILPDGPLNLCLVAAALSLAGVLFAEAPQRASEPWRGWLQAGLWIGLAALSKYQAAFFAAGLVVFVATTPKQRRWLTHPAAWAGALLALTLVSPVLVWNAQHDWVSFRFQGGRGEASGHFNPTGPLVALAGQAALLFPWIFLPLAASLLGAAAAGPRQPRRWFLLCLAAPAIVVFSTAPLWSKAGLPHWSMPGWLMAAPLAGAWLARLSRRRRWPRTWAMASAAALALIWPAAAIETATGALGKVLPSAGDPTAETVQWRALRAVVARRQAAGGCVFVAGARWNEAGKIGQAVGDLAPVRAISTDPRGFAFLGGASDLIGCDALIVGRAGKIEADLPVLRSYFAAIQPLTIDVEGRGAPEIRLAVYDARRLLHALPNPYGRNEGP